MANVEAEIAAAQAEEDSPIVEQSGPVDPALLKKYTALIAENYDKYPSNENLAFISDRYKAEIAELRHALVMPATPTTYLTDVICYRFLKGWKFNTRDAAVALSATLKWREENKMDAIREELRTRHLSQNDFPFATKWAKCFPQRISHFDDKKGQPLSVDKAGKVNLALTLATLTVDDLIEYQKYALEYMEMIRTDLMEKTGHLVRFCKVMDLKGLGAKHVNRAGFKHLKECLKQGSAHYPESLGHMYIINAPYVFNLLWKLVSIWIKPSTRKKISIASSANKAALLEAIDEEKLPEFLGGTCVCANVEGGCVREVDADDGYEKVTVPRRSVHTHRVEVPAGTRAVKWEFRTVSRNIHFGADFVPAGRPSEPVVERTKFECQTLRVRGSYTVQEGQSGEMIFTWSNEFSRMYGKTLLFSVLLEEGAKEKEEEKGE